MTVTVELKNRRTLDLLKAIEGVGLIRVNSPEKPDQEETPPYHWMQGCCKGIPGGSVDDFLARSSADKEHELEIEKREQEERDRRRAGIHT
jgi:hypothetical protein